MLNINTDEWKQIFKNLPKNSEMYIKVKEKSLNVFVVGGYFSEEKDAFFCYKLPTLLEDFEFGISFLHLEKLKKLITKNPKKQISR